MPQRISYSKFPEWRCVAGSVGVKSEKWMRITGVVRVVLLGMMLGLAGCGGMRGAGWGNPDVCSPGQFAGKPSLMLVDNVLLLQGSSMRSLYALQVNDGTVLWQYQTGKLLGASGNVVFEQGLGDVLYAVRANDGL